MLLAKEKRFQYFSLETLAYGIACLKQVFIFTNIILLLLQTQNTSRGLIEKPLEVCIHLVKNSVGIGRNFLLGDSVGLLKNRIETV